MTVFARACELKRILGEGNQPMSYIDQPGMSKNRTTALVGVGIIHVILGWALMNGLATHIKKVIANPMEAFDIEEIAKPDDAPPPPPPPEVQQVYVPPPAFDVFVPAPVQTTTITNAPPPPPPPPPPPKAEPVRTAPKLIVTQRRIADLQSDYYPPTSLRLEEEGTTEVVGMVDASGKVADCEVTKPSGFPRLDEASCKLLKKLRAAPGTVDGQDVAMKAPPIRITWQIAR